MFQNNQPILIFVAYVTDPAGIQDAPVQQRGAGDRGPQVRLPGQPGAHRRHPPGGGQTLPEQRLDPRIS